MCHTLGNLYYGIMNVYNLKRIVDFKQCLQTITTKTRGL